MDPHPLAIRRPCDFAAVGAAGGAIAILVYYALGTLAFAFYLRSPASLLRLALGGVGLRWPLFRDILRVGLVATVSSLATNLTIGVTTALVGSNGPAAIAGPWFAGGAGGRGGVECC